ncbi:hypothetical protein PG994_009479 [Apiospora phragmitis]|uniref:Uncharacterized protein n=1 Tax=Apiospora phragmitis TaxID=2905665 RepID=A0ABR1ULR7_9PEZI
MARLEVRNEEDDLFSKLHDQYNTFQSTIQDPEAFHHDVYEISNSASTSDEFHRLLADRREQRLRELNDGLESASLEIIANPRLIGTHQWQYALQLFRSKSLDSLVRYFASYLPDDHPWRQSYSDDDEQNNGDARTTVSSTDSAVYVVGDHDRSSSKLFFDDGDHYFITDEPLAIDTSVPASHLPPSPQSMTMCSDSSAASPVSDDAHHEYSLATLTPARTLSFSGSESDVMAQSGLLPFEHDYEETSQPDDSPVTSVSDMSESRFSTVELGQQRHKHDFGHEAITPAECEGSVEDSVESDTPRPRNETPTDSYMSLRPSRSVASLRGTPSLYAHVLQEYARSSRKNRRDGSPSRTVRRKSPELGRIQKPLQDPVRVRPKGRQRND